MLSLPNIMAVGFPIARRMIVRFAISVVLLLAPLASAQTGGSRSADPAGEAQRAQALVAAGKLDDAIRIYQDLVRGSPQNPILLLNLCVAEYTGKRYREAAATATAALKLDPNLLPARLFLGASRLELGDLPAAIDALQTVVASNPRERNGRLMLGVALLESGQPAAAIDHLEAAAEMLPASSRVWYGLARARAALGKPLPRKRPGAADCAAPLTRISPPRSRGPQCRAALAGSRSRVAGSAAAVARQARDSVGLGEALFRSRDYPGAMSVLKPLLSSDNAEVQFLYGASLLNLQEPLEAIPYLREAISKDSGLLPPRAALGQALLQTGKPAEAIPFLESALSVDPDGSTHFQIFRAYQMTHRDAEARKALDEYHRFRTSLAPRP